LRQNESTKSRFLVGAFGGNYTGKLLLTLEEAGIPVYHTPRRMMKAIKVLVKNE